MTHEDEKADRELAAFQALGPDPEDDHEGRERRLEQIGARPVRPPR
jgi:hypothetical protein